MSDDVQTCPRRMFEFGPWEREEGLDRWVNDVGLIGQNDVGLSCSFCGSLNPDRFMELVRSGWVVDPTDKNYKVYLESPLTDEEKAKRRDDWMKNNYVVKAVRDQDEKDGKTPEQIQAKLDEVFGTPYFHGDKTAKFYYQHLSKDQRIEFIDLLNSNRMVVGYPSHLYTIPFFASVKVSECGFDINAGQAL